MQMQMEISLPSLALLSLLLQVASSLPQSPLDCTFDANGQPSSTCPGYVSGSASSSSALTGSPHANQTISSDLSLSNSSQVSTSAASNASIRQQDATTTFSGPEGAFPPEASWVSFDQLWDVSNALCVGQQNGAQGALIKDDIAEVAAESGVDARVILAVVLQESNCNLEVVTTNNGVRNPGIMQSHNGASYDGTNASILQMLRDGVEGTADGDGLKQLIAQYGTFAGLRAYNSGPGGVDPGDLSQTSTGDPDYVSSIAHKLVGLDVTS